MELTCNSIELARAVEKVSKAIRSANVLRPALTGIKFKAQGKSLTLYATDLEIAIEKTIVASVTEEGEVIAPGATLKDFVKSLSDDTVEIKSENLRLTINYGKSVAVMNCFDLTEFPKTPAVEKEKSITIAKEEFKDAVSKVAFCAATDEARPLLKGILLKSYGEKLDFVALDGYRMAKVTKKIGKGIEDMSRIVPATALKIVEGLVEASDEMMVLNFEKNYLLVEIEYTRIMVRLLEGDYLDYNQIIPKEFETTLIVPRDAFKAALERARLLSLKDTSLVKFDIGRNSINLTANGTEGNLDENVFVKNNGSDVKTAFNVKYLLDSLSKIESDSFAFKCSSNTMPAVLEPIGGKVDALFLVLPVRVIN
ncbi:MAG: DNA polymerase III subunit beta [Firmicutes bacterium]|nr:DNA polymerase III subunit beta [Bacillota bacterium]